MDTNAYLDGYFHKTAGYVSAGRSQMGKIPVLRRIINRLQNLVAGGKSNLSVHPSTLEDPKDYIRTIAGSKLYPELRASGINFYTVPPTDTRWKEYKMFRKFMPKSRKVPIGWGDPEQWLKTKFGKKWIIKVDDSYATGAESIIVPENIKRLHRTRLGDITVIFKDGTSTTFNPRNAIAMKRRNISIPAWKRLLSSKEGKYLGDWGGENVHRNTHEWRVHLVTGPKGTRVVPRVTDSRGNAWDRFVENWMPYGIRTPSQKKVEEFAAKVGRAIPKKYSKKPSVWGLDVGIDSKGRPFLIEANPSTKGGYYTGYRVGSGGKKFRIKTEGGASGWLDDPGSLARIVAAHKGLPAPVNRWDDIETTGKLIGGAGVVGGIGYGGWRYKNRKNRSKASPVS